MICSAIAWASSLRPSLAGNADGASVPVGLGYCLGGAGDEGHAGAVCRKLAHERAAEAGRAAGYGTYDVLPRL